MKNFENSRHSLYMDVYNEIKNDILMGKYPPGSILPTELELSESFFVSRITIQKAMQLLKKEGYISRTPGRGTFVENIPAKPQQHIVGLVLCNIAFSFGLRILTAVERTAAAHGYHIIYKNSIDSLEEETKAINDLVALGAEGIIIPSVSTNNFEAAQKLTQYLFDKGHEKIGFVSSPPANTSSVQERLDGFNSMYITEHKTVEDYYILNTMMSPHSANDSIIFQQDIEQIKKYLTDHQDLTALISSEFTITQMITNAVQEIGKNIPDDYSLVMFDAYESVSLPLITHIYQDQEEIGRIAFDTLLSIISQKTVGNKIYVPFKIIEGDSVKDLNKA